MAAKIENLVVGAGISGATMARLLAESGESVAVIDMRDHVGGNCYDYKDDGITTHRYGTHIFRTDSKEVWDFLSRFTKWYPYQHKVLALLDGQFVPVP
ncbi:MAG: FAD-dependent oxidoreductase, partial [Synergistaceae bacterium]|nr:FAD-dependent oxidoreductase [Synergistaceae bacterium]